MQNENSYLWFLNFLAKKKTQTLWHLVSNLVFPRVHKSHWVEISRRGCGVLGSNIGIIPCQRVQYMRNYESGRPHIKMWILWNKDEYLRIVYEGAYCRVHWGRNEYIEGESHREVETWVATMIYMLVGWLVHLGTVRLHISEITV